MTDPVRALFDEFRRDHEILGHGLHDIAVALRADDDAQASEAARRLDRAAGAHIAFEERYFYPELRKLLGDVEVNAFESQHALGHAAIARLVARTPGDAPFSKGERGQLLRQIETMQVHTDECGEHFGALGRIPQQRQQELLEALQHLRKASPTWAEVAGEVAER